MSAMNTTDGLYAVFYDDSDKLLATVEQTPEFETMHGKLMQTMTSFKGRPKTSDLKSDILEATQLFVDALYNCKMLNVPLKAVVDSRYWDMIGPILSPADNRQYHISFLVNEEAR